MHDDKTPVPLIKDDPQYLKGLGKPMPFHSHSEFMAATKVYQELLCKYRHFRSTMHDSDHAEMLHLEQRINNHENKSE